MKKMIYSSLLGLILCAQPVFSALPKPVVTGGAMERGEPTSSQALFMLRKNPTILNRKFTARTRLMKQIKVPGNLEESISSLTTKIGLLGRSLGGLRSQATHARNALVDNPQDESAITRLEKIKNSIRNKEAERTELEAQLIGTIYSSATELQKQQLDALNTEINQLRSTIEDQERHLDSLLGFV